MPLFCCFSSPSPTPKLASSPHLRRSTLQAACTNLAKIFEELKCPVCFNVCVPPIHNCINGHIICNSCRLKGHVTLCPTCRQNLSSPARNMFAENFVLNYAQQCCYASQGCEHLRLKGCGTMKTHEEKCTFRPLPCLVRSCGLKIPYKNFLAHLTCGHKCCGSSSLPALVQFKFSPHLQNKRWVPYHIQAFDNLYYVMMQRKKKKVWIWVLSQLGKEADDLENSYSAQIKLKHPEKKVQLSWHGPVYPIRTPGKVIRNKEGTCFNLPASLVRNFVVKGGNLLNLVVDIRKVARRSLKGVKIPGEGDSDTQVVGGGQFPRPEEYNRPASFYEPSGAPPQVLASPPVPPPQEETQENEVLNRSLGYHHLLHEPNYSTGEDKLVEDFPPRIPPPTVKRRTPRTAAIGIPSLFTFPPSQTSTVTSFLDTIPPPPENLTSNDEGGDAAHGGDLFGDKVVIPAYQTQSLQRDMEKQSNYYNRN